MKVQAQWTGNATRSGYVVRIRTTEPKNRVYARCSTGTTCAVSQRVPARLDDEWSWVLEVVTVHGQRVVAGFQVCASSGARRRAGAPSRRRGPIDSPCRQRR
jgi:hypothetical protein